ncbi:MAG: type II secretion system major pseudopilin GspG [Caldilineaceae bacterium]|nr:type II secretion system major pseudopilin GspG [Caldilineaceae bacterium]
MTDHHWLGKGKRRTKIGTVITSDDDGFTILEILIVLAIISLIASLGSLQLMNYFSRAKVETTKLQLNQLVLAIDLFSLDMQRVPTPEEDLKALIERPADSPKWSGPYLKSASALVDPWDAPYQYGGSDGGKPYVLYSTGADRAPGGEGFDKDIYAGQ